jgi:hypothetical protein
MRPLAQAFMFFGQSAGRCTSHEKVLTFANYGELTASRQAEIMQELWDPASHDDEELRLARRLVRAARRSQQ